MPQAFPWSRFCKASGGGGQLGKRSPRARATGDLLPLSGAQGRRGSPAGPGAERSSGCAHLRCVVRPDAREAPVAWLVVLPQPGLARDQTAQAEERKAAEQLQEPTLAVHVDPCSHGQLAARVRPYQRLVVQGVAHRIARPLPLLAQGPHTAGQLGDQPRPHLSARHGQGGLLGPAGRPRRRRAWRRKRRVSPANESGRSRKRRRGRAGHGEGWAREGRGRPPGPGARGRGGPRRGRSRIRTPRARLARRPPRGPGTRLESAGRRPRRCGGCGLGRRCVAWRCSWTQVRRAARVEARPWARLDGLLPAPWEPAGGQGWQRAVRAVGVWCPRRGGSSDRRPPCAPSQPSWKTPVPTP